MDASPTGAATPSLADMAPLTVVVTAIAAAAVAEEQAADISTAAASTTAEAPVLTRRSRRSARAGAVEAPALSPEPFELLEPAIDTLPDDVDVSTDDRGYRSAEATEDARDTASDFTAADADAFEAAARLFSFTGETPVQSQTEAEQEPARAEAAHVAPHRNRGASFKRVTAASFSVGVMGIVGLLTVGMTTPADAVVAVDGTDITTSLVATVAGDVEPGDAEVQAYVAPAEVESLTIDRAETYSTLTMAQLASESGISNFSNYFVNNPNSPIQWPFAVGVSTSYGFGMRDGSMHEGADFTPGEGAPIQAIADGVVRESTDAGGAFGVHIVIDHVIDGQLVSSSYSHMIYGSRQVEVGDTVTVGTVIGNTGNTGHSFGAHLHFEILAGGTTPIDPIPWLREHAGG